ncbi:hypothetical protein [Sphingobacterium multivorum]|uniref:Uncharacterized protein n=1 Tax=Sphingobacterium multivorum TaxID=28454 RepID=A0A653YQA1_SPHMU|nr:hypothetical protein [Sphingobacterium multivorum]VXC44696.1 conserved hypothetical protein [Sphingobacterium multivorum]
MCEIITKWGASEWAGIIQALGAIISSIFLFYTFNSQKESAEISEKSAELDRKAKRAEYLPEIKSDLKIEYPNKPNMSGGFIIDAFNGSNTTVTVIIKFNKAPVQILDFDYLKTEKYIQMEIYPFPFDEKKILMAGEFFEIKFYINLQKHFDLVNEGNDPDFSSIVECNGIDYRKKIFLHNKLLFSDMLGNKYELKFNVIGLEKLELSGLTMID